MKKEFGFITKDELLDLINVSGKRLSDAANEKNIVQINYWIDYINEQYETLKQYESE